MSEEVPRVFLDNVLPSEEGLHGLGGSYKAKLEDNFRPTEKGVSVAHIAHDSWCGIFDNKECNCDPEITIERIL